MKRSTRTLAISLLLALAGGFVIFYAVNHLPLTHTVQAVPPRLLIDEAPVTRTTLSPTSFAPVVDRVASSVVNINTTTRLEAEPDHPLLRDPLFRRFFGQREMPTPPRQRQGVGSGVIVSPNGFILTSNHIIEGADRITVTLLDGREYTAQVVGTDPPTDVALLKIDDVDLPTVVMTDSNNMRVGDIVLAVGNPFGVGQTVTMGIVSATGRGGFGLVDYEDFIQTDASINPGNSGGALTDAEGRLIGINTFIISRTGGAQGLGFAVPVNMARVVMEQLIEQGRVVRGFLGVHVQTLTRDLAEGFGLPPQLDGAVVGEVTPRSPAARAGLEPGDIIIEINDQHLSDSRDLRLRIAQTRPGTRINLTVLRPEGRRDFREYQIPVTLGELPSDGERADAPRRGDVPRPETGSIEGAQLGQIDRSVRQQLDLPPDLEGVLIVQVEPGSRAFEAGLRPGHVIMELNRQPVRNPRELRSLLNQLENGTLLLRVWTPEGRRFLVLRS
jgi:serine protease Do